MEWTPQQQEIIDRINSGREDYTFGPGSPGATFEDRNTYVGGRYSPAGGFTIPGGVALAPSEYNLFTPSQRQSLGIMDIAPRNQAGQIERYYPGKPGNIFSRGFSTLTNPGRAAGNFWAEHFGGDRGNRDWSPSQLAAAGVPYYPEGSPTSEALGPLLEKAFGGDDRGGGLRMGGVFGTPGTGAPTRNVAGLIGTVAGNALFPGLGVATGPAAKWLAGKFQFGGGPRGNPVARPATQPQSQPVRGSNAPSGGNFSPQYLRSIGYEPGQGTDSLWPGGGSSAGPRDVGAYGVGGGGGSFFHDLPGVRGGPLAGSFAGLGAGSGGTISGSAGNALAGLLARNMLRTGQIQNPAVPNQAASDYFYKAFMNSPVLRNWGPVVQVHAGDPVGAANLAALRNFGGATSTQGNYAGRFFKSPS
jgi:hypothetical protein